MPRRWSVRRAQPDAQCSHAVGGGHQVERPRPEPVRRAGQRTHRADLHRVAGEVGVERLPRVDADLLVGAALDQLDERVAGDLLGEPGAAGAGDAALAVEQHLAGQWDRLGEGALGAVEAGLGAAVGHRLVLQRALAALVADRAVQRVVDQQQLHDAVLRLVGDRRGELGAHDHAVARPSSCTTPARLALALAPRPGTGGRRRPGRAAGGRRSAGSAMPSCSAARMTSVPLGTLISIPSMVRLTRSVRCSTAPLPGVPVVTVIRRALPRRRWRPPGRTDIRRCSRCAMYSSRKYWMEDVTGLVAPSPSAQNDAPEDVVGQVEQLVEVASGLPSPALEPVQDLHQPVGALAAGRALAAGLVLVELASSAAPPAPRRWSRRRSAAPWCRASSLPRRCPRSRAARRGARSVSSGVDEPPGVQNFSSWPSRMPPAQLEQLAQGDPQRGLVLAGPGHVAGQRVQREARRLLGAHRAEPVDAAARRWPGRARSTRRC